MSDSNAQPPEPNPYSPPASSAEPPVAWNSEPVIDSLRQTQPWVRFLSVLGFIGAAIIFLAGLVQTAAALGEPTARKVGAAMGGGMFTALLGVLYFVPALYLSRFAAGIDALTRNRRLSDLEAALAAQKSFWRYCGIAAVLLLTLYVLIIVGGFLQATRG